MFRILIFFKVTKSTQVHSVRIPTNYYPTGISKKSDSKPVTLSAEHGSSKYRRIRTSRETRERVYYSSTKKCRIHSNNDLENERLTRSLSLRGCRARYLKKKFLFFPLTSGTVVWKCLIFDTLSFRSTLICVMVCKEM